MEGWATRLFPPESGGSSTKPVGYCSKVCLFVCASISCFLSISLFIHNSHTTETSYSPSSLIGSASTGMFWLRRFLRSSALISEA